MRIIYTNNFDFYKEAFNCKNVPNYDVDQWGHTKIELSKLLMKENSIVNNESFDDYLMVILHFHYGEFIYKIDEIDLDQIRNILPKEYQWMKKNRYLMPGEDENKMKIIYVEYNDWTRYGFVWELTIGPTGEILSDKTTLFNKK